MPLLQQRYRNAIQIEHVGLQQLLQTIAYSQTLVITEVFELRKEIVTGAATINADPVVARFAESCPTKLTDVLEKDLFGIDSVLSA